MQATIREFLETGGLYERFRPRSGIWWNGSWPEVVDVPCHACGGGKKPHTIFATKVAGFTPAWGVYMIHGSCAQCASDGLMFWVEVNHREGWMQKAGQLPSAVEGRKAVANSA